MIEVKKVKPSNLNIVSDILTNLIDASNRKDPLPSTNYIETLLMDDRTYLLAAMIDNAVIGYALAYRFPSLYAPKFLAYLYDIEVSKPYRRKGAGRLLIQTLLHYLKADNVEELWLGTGIDNPEGQGLFSSTGAIKSAETFTDYTYYL